MARSVVYLCAAGWLLAASAGCGDGGEASSLTQEAASRDHHANGEAEASAETFGGDYPIKVTCTTGMVADLVRHVGSDQVDVTQLMGETVDPHLFQAVPADISALNRADVIFYSGLHLEGKLVEIFARMRRKKPTSAVAERIDNSRLLDVGAGLYDPHVWFDVELWSVCISAVSDTLSQFDPKHAADYQKRADLYRKELVTLHEYCVSEMATIPEGQRVLVTAHDAFHYMGRAYGLEVKAIQGISTESEPGVKEINELVEFLTTNGIRAVFVESSVPDANMASLVEGCASRGHTLEQGGVLFSDAMGKLGTPEGTYVGMVRHNVNTIVQALR